jgi:Skp family chaperone for outer membrane proteins
MYRKQPRDKKSGLPKKYVPASLSAEDRKKQIKSIKEKKSRPKVESFESKRSPFTERFEKKYGYKISNLGRISKEIIKRKGIDLIISKGMAAYYNTGSRPNQTPQSWSLARLASVILNGPARKVDKSIWDKYKI